MANSVSDTAGVTGGAYGAQLFGWTANGSGSQATQANQNPVVGNYVNPE